MTILPALPDDWQTAILPASFELWKTTVRRPLNDRLYHYTSAEALIGILSSHQMWATHLRYATDPTELIYAQRVIRGAFERARLRYCVDVGHNSPLRAWVESFDVTLERHLQHNDYYCISFCENGDLLSQWHGYGGSGSGFAMGWVADSQLIGRAFSTAAIEYRRDEQDRLVDETIRMHVEQFIAHGIPDDVSRLADSNYHVLLTGSLGSQLAIYLYAFKDQAFAQEHEFRLLYRFRDGDYSGWSEPLFRRFGNMIKPYIEVDLDAAVLDEIIYGPTLEPTLTEKWLGMALRRCGYSDASARPSEIQMR